MFMAGETWDLNIDAPDKVLGSEQLKMIEETWCLWAGDIDHSGINNVGDYNGWVSNPAAINVYLPADINRNGIIDVLDVNFWKVNSAKVGATETQGLYDCE